MPTINPTIVNVNTTVSSAPVPSQLQQSGAIVSIGGTTLSTGSYQFCGTLAAVTAILSTAGNYTEVANMAGTFFAQGNAVGVYVLELGVEGTVPAGITALGTWITANPGIFYAYLTPLAWDASGAALNTMAANYASPTGRTYFFITTTTTTISAYAVTTKSIIATVASPLAAGTEFQAAVLFYQWIANNPSIATPVSPMNFRFAYGVTPWAPTGSTTAIDTVLTAFGNVILTGAEGGISTALIRNGTTMDGNQMIFWFAVDWFQINAKVQLANAVINGSNSNPPLYYNQAGVNTLLSVAKNVASTGVSIGLLLSTTATASVAATPSVSAVPFATYIAANPTNYASGVYNGLSATITPQTGFTSITFNIDATQFA
jgi:hypothetical protein